MHNDMPCATLFDFIRDQDLKFIQSPIMYVFAKLQLISLSEKRL